LTEARLTIREREIAVLIQRDQSNKEIATGLGIEVATVKNHVHNLLEKLNVHRLSEAIRLLSRAPRAVAAVTDSAIVANRTTLAS